MLVCAEVSGNRVASRGGCEDVVVGVLEAECPSDGFACGTCGWRHAELADPACEATRPRVSLSRNSTGSPLCRAPHGGSALVALRLGFDATAQTSRGRGGACSRAVTLDTRVDVCHAVGLSQGSRIGMTDRRRARIELGLALFTGALAGLTIAWPEWIEGLLGVEPDAGSGAAEWGIVIVLLLLTLAFGVMARRDMRRAASSRAQAGHAS